MFALENGQPGQTFIKKAPACDMWTLAEAIAPNHTIEIIGPRHGEKEHESLISQEEMYRTKDLGDYFCIEPDSRDLNYDKFFVDGQEAEPKRAYTSDSTDQLTTAQVKEILDGTKATRS